MLSKAILFAFSFMILQSSLFPTPSSATKKNQVVPDALEVGKKDKEGDYTLPHTEPDYLIEDRKKDPIKANKQRSIDNDKKAQKDLRKSLLKKKKNRVQIH